MEKYYYLGNGLFYYRYYLVHNIARMFHLPKGLENPPKSPFRRGGL